MQVKYRVITPEIDSFVDESIYRAVLSTKSTSQAIAYTDLDFSVHYVSEFGVMYVRYNLNGEPLENSLTSFDCSFLKHRGDLV